MRSGAGCYILCLLFHVFSREWKSLYCHGLLWIRYYYVWLVNLDNNKRVASYCMHSTNTLLQTSSGWQLLHTRLSLHIIMFTYSWKMSSALCSSSTQWLLAPCSWNWMDTVDRLIKIIENIYIAPILFIAKHYGLHSGCTGSEHWASFNFS